MDTANDTEQNVHTRKLSEVFLINRKPDLFHFISQLVLLVVVQSYCSDKHGNNDCYHKLTPSRYDAKKDVPSRSVGT